MTWLEFVSAVKIDLPVDNERIGIATGTPNYLEQQLLYAVIQLQQAIEFYQQGHETVYGVADLVVEGNASVGSLPATEQCRPLEARLGLVTDECLSYPYGVYPWTSRLDLVCGFPRIQRGQLFMAIDPQAKQFTVYPTVLVGNQIVLKWDGVKTSFLDADVVPFDKDCVEAVGLFVKAKIARLVDHDLNEFASYISDWQRRKLLLFADSRKRTRLNSTANSPSTPSQCSIYPWCVPA